MRLERCRPPERHAAECPIFLQVQAGRLWTLYMSLRLGEDITFLELNLAVRGKSDPMHTLTVPCSLVAYTIRCSYTPKYP